MIDPVLDTATVVTKRDAMFVGHPDGVAGYVTGEVPHRTHLCMARPFRIESRAFSIIFGSMNSTIRYCPGCSYEKCELVRQGKS